MQTDTPPAPRPPIRRVQAVINAAAGTVGPDCEAQLQAVLDRFDLQSQVHMAQPDKLEEILRRAVADDPDLLVVLGGDGTIRYAASLCGPQRPLLAPLPGGSMNMLPIALYGRLAWPEALAAALQDGVARPVSGGDVDGRRFYCAAILGTPALWQPVREAARGIHLLTAMQKASYALRRTFSRRLRFSVRGGQTRRAVALCLICPSISRRAELKDGLEAATMNVSGLAELFRLTMHNVLDDWRTDPAVLSEPCTQGRAWARKPIPCLLDGEMQWLGRAADIRFRPHAFTALAPPDGMDT